MLLSYYLVFKFWKLYLKLLTSFKIQPLVALTQHGSGKKRLSHPEFLAFKQSQPSKQTTQQGRTPSQTSHTYWETLCFLSPLPTTSASQTTMLDWLGKDKVKAFIFPSGCFILMCVELVTGGSFRPSST